MININNSMMQDSAKIANNAFDQGLGIVDTKNVWMWLAIAELIVIWYILFIHPKRIPKHNSKAKFKKESLENEIDFGNIILSSFKATQLYNELKVTCHPDRFATDEAKSTIANSLFQEINKNSTNYKKMIELKEDAKRTLNINFKT